jgi:hypothetical protein
MILLTLDLEPVLRRPGSARAALAFRDDAFELHRTGLPKQRLTLAALDLAAKPEPRYSQYPKKGLKALHSHEARKYPLFPGG